MIRYTNPEHTEATTGEGNASGNVKDLIRLNYLKEDDVIEPYVEPVPSADEIFVAKIQLLVGNVPQEELDTFPIQASEAKEWEADSNAEVQFIRDLAGARGIPIDVLVSKILKKSAPYSKAIASVLGAKHRAEDLIDKQLGETK